MSSSLSLVCKLSNGRKPIKRQRRHDQPKASSVNLNDSHRLSVEHGIHRADQADNHRASENQSSDETDGHNLEKDGGNDDSHRNRKLVAVCSGDFQVGGQSNGELTRAGLRRSICNISPHPGAE